ncbi:hypothetical protein BDY24DRAFT_404377 [Mrakia frigida]|uniref:uncharacterized protein n=1 Tax=Mrakia frigida TaxID=29902 RepID=UPI003FCBF7E3
MSYPQSGPPSSSDDESLPPPPPLAYNGSGYPVPFTVSSASRVTSQQPSSSSNSNFNGTSMSASSSSSATSLPSTVPIANAPPSQDLSTLRKVKALITTGQHPEYTAIIKPQALKSVSVSAAEAKEQLDKAINVKPKVIKASKPQPLPSLFREAGDGSVVAGASTAGNGDVEKKSVDSEGAAGSASSAVVDLKNGSSSTSSSNKRDLSTAQGSSSSLEDRLDDKRIKMSTSNLDGSVTLPLPASSSSSNSAAPLNSPNKTQDANGSTLRSPTWLPLTSADKSTTSSSTDPASSSGQSSAPPIVSNPAAAPSPLPSTDPLFASQPLPNIKTLLERTALPQEKLIDPSTPVQSLASRIFASPNASSDSNSSRRQPPSEIPSPSSAVSGRAPRVTAADSWRPSPSSNPSTPTTSKSIPVSTSNSSGINPATKSTTLTNSVALPPSSSAASSDAKAPTDDLEAKERTLQLERDEAERERLRAERKLREKSIERAKYLEWEKEKEMYREKLRKEREREKEMDVEKLRLERERSTAGGSRARGYDDFGRPDPQSHQPSLPPSNWDPRPAIDARFPPRAQPQPSDAHYVPPQPYKPTPAVYERPRPDGRPSSLLQDPRDFPPDPYYDRLPPPPPAPPARRPFSPPPPARSYGGRSPSPPRRGPYGRSPSPPRRVGAYGDAGPSSRPLYRDDRDRRDGWVDDRDRAPIYAPPYRAGGPPDVYGYDRERERFPPPPPPPPSGRRSPPPSSYGGPGGRGRSPPLSQDPAEILREMERTKEKLARLEKEAAVKRLLLPSSSGGPGSGGMGRVGSGGGGGFYGGGGDRGRDSYELRGPPGTYRDGPPPGRPYSPPPRAQYQSGPPPPRGNLNNSNNYPPPVDSYSYNNSNNNRGPPPPLPPQQYPPPPARYDRYNGPPRRDEPPYGGGGGGPPRRDEPPYDSRDRDPRGGDPRDRDGGRGYGPGGGGVPLPPLRRDERDWGRR